MKPIYFILLSILLVSSGQLILKFGMTQLGVLDFSLGSIADTAIKIALTPYVIIGVLLFGLSSVLWLTALSRAELSYAYPLFSIGYAIVSISSWFLFNEKMNGFRIAGIAIIILGVSILSLNGGQK